MVRLLEKDLTSLARERRQSPSQWNEAVEFVYLSVLLNVYSFCLRLSSAASPGDPDHTIIQSAAAHSACRMVEIYASSPSPTAGADTPSTLQSVRQRWFPKFYLRFQTIALLMLLKISALNQISMQELGEVNDSIRLGHGALMACSSSEGDECHRAAAVVEVLCKKGIIDSVSCESPVQSRFGASLWLELVATAIRWRRQNSKHWPKPRNSVSVSSTGNNSDKRTNNNDNGNDNDRRGGENTFPASRTSSRPLIGMGDVAMAMTAPTETRPGPGPAPPDNNSMDETMLALADIQANVNLFPFNNENWSTYLDATQADLAWDFDSGWWGGLGD